MIQQGGFPPYFPRVHRGQRTITTRESAQRSTLVTHAEAREFKTIKRKDYTSSPSSSTTGFLTLILVFSEAMVRDWVRYREVDPDQRVDAAMRVVRGRRSAEEKDL